MHKTLEFLAWRILLTAHHMEQRYIHRDAGPTGVMRYVSDKGANSMPGLYA